MNVWIARDGETIGEYPRERLDALAQTGGLQKTDHYWHDGMETWRSLDELLGPSAWEAPDRPAAIWVAPWAGWDRRRWVIAGSSTLAAVVLAVALLRYAVSPGHAAKTAHALGAPESASSDAAARDAATSQLVARLNQLPKVAAAPGYTAYDSLAIQVPRPPGELTATIRGSEIVAEPETLAAISRSDFALSATFRHGKWVLQRYHESHHDLRSDTITETEKDYGYPVPPAIASLLGIDTGG